MNRRETQRSLEDTTEEEEDGGGGRESEPEREIPGQEPLPSTHTSEHMEAPCPRALPPL